MFVNLASIFYIPVYILDNSIPIIFFTDICIQWIISITGPEYAIRSGKGLGCVSIKFFCLYSEHFSRFRCEKQTWLLSPIIIVTGCTTHISRTLCNDTLQSKENNSPRPQIAYHRSQTPSTALNADSSVW